MKRTFELATIAVVLFAACADKEITAPPESECDTLGQRQCTLAGVLQECRELTDAFRWVDVQNCAAEYSFGCEGDFRPYACTPTLGCTPCPPKADLCSGNELDILRCTEAGEIDCTPIETCNTSLSEVCVSGDGAVRCRNACEVAVEQLSYVGCEYYAVDLDNANVGEALNAASQQFAVVISNPSPALTATVVVEQNDAAPGTTLSLSVVAGPVEVGPRELEVINLPPREVDGSPPGEFNTGSHTALSSNAYRVTSSAPIIVYQFNPLENAGVFSNDASLLIPISALGVGSSSVSSNYLAISWPQTIADTDDPSTDFDEHLRSFLTVVGVEDQTTVTVELSTDIVGSKDITDITKGSTIELVLGPFDVLNLETGSFNADFTGTQVLADGPILVFTGSEASDVPTFPGLEQRECCADHLEEQLSPTHTLGTTFVAVRTPSRTCALDAAGADIRCEENEYDVFRFVASGEFPSVTTSLPAPDDDFDLSPGQPRDVHVYEDFWMRSTGPLEVGQFVTSQWVVCGPGNNDQPCGDPAFMLLPPIEQYRDNYLILVPDKYAFDYLLLTAPADADIRLDDQPIDDFSFCTRRAIPDAVPVQNETIDFSTITCALSDPTVYSGPPTKIDPGLQRDGVHWLRANKPFGLMVYGFDAFVSYAYAGGTNLLPINIE